MHAPTLPIPLFSILLAASLASAGATAQERAPAQHTPLPLGSPLPGDALLFDLDAEPHELADLSRKVTVVCFFGAGSDSQREHDPHLKALGERFGGGDTQVAFVHVASNANDIGLLPPVPGEVARPYKRVRRHLEQHELPFEVYADHKNALADRLGATRTPELFVFAGDDGLVYRGAIEPARLAPVLEALVAGRAVEPSATRPTGDAIRRAHNSAPAGAHSLFVDDPEAAVDEAVRDKKLLVYAFTGFQCGNARLMELRTMRATETVAWMRPHFVEARLHTDTKNTLTDERFEANVALQKQLAETVAIPAYVVVDPATSKVLGRFTLAGAPDTWSERWRRFLRGVLSDRR